MMVMQRVESVQQSQLMSDHLMDNKEWMEGSREQEIEGAE